MTLPFGFIIALLIVLSACGQTGAHRSYIISEHQVQCNEESPQSADLR